MSMFIHKGEYDMSQKQNDHNSDQGNANKGTSGTNQTHQHVLDNRSVLLNTKQTKGNKGKK